jgi:hypothetical protein
MSGQTDGTQLMGPNVPANGSPIGAFKNQILVINSDQLTHVGAWLDASDLLNMTLGVEGAGTGFTIQFWASNAEVQPPTAGSGGVKIGNDITAAGMYAFTGPYRWINVRMTVGPTNSQNIGAVLQTLTP